MTRINYSDSAVVATKHVLTEKDYGAAGAAVFVASAAVFDWPCVRMQMMVLHGCAKVVNRDA